MLSIKTCQRLREVGVEATRAEEFANGIKLLQLVCNVYYGGENPALSAKIKWSDDNKTGNKVVNINMILNFIKKDSNITLPPAIRDLTAFKVIQQNDAMVSLVQHLVAQMPPKHTSIQMSPPRQHQNQFQNLYFAASIGKNVYQSDDSLQVDNKGETVVRKGSFKVLKPKMSSQSKNKSSDSKEMQRDERINSEQNRMNNQFKIEPLKEIYVLDNQAQEEANSRKTIPKMYEKPPLYRSKQKQSHQKERTQMDEKKQTPMVTASQTDRQAIMKNIQNISGQIAEEERSLHLLNNSNINSFQNSNQNSHQNSNKNSKHQPPKQRSSRKIFKLDLIDIGEARKKVLTQWLIGINILAISSAKHALSLHSICKDGVIFMEVVNYYGGRGKNLCFFKEPKRSAELHSNYQKLFAFLQESPDFRSELIHQYEYFIPEAQPNAFWGLLSSIHSCYCRRKPKNTSIERYQNSVERAVQRTNSHKKNMNESVSYQQLKYNSDSTSKDRKDIRSNFSSIELPRKQTPKPNSQKSHVPTQKSQSSQKKPAPYGLVQNEQPIEQNMRTERGYKEMYLCKFKNMETPSKNRSFSNSSLSKSRMRSSAESAKKMEARSAPPSVTLEMQMTVLKYLSNLGIEEQEELFRDPFRNGVLLCLIVKKQWDVDCFASKRPRSIDDCRNNFLTAIEVVRSRRKSLKVSYEYFVEQLVKGEKSLLYGLIWNVIRDQGKSSHPPHPPQMQQFNGVELDEGNWRGQEEQRISWVRSIEKHSSQIAALKIRSEETLFSAILNTDFLFHYAAFITGKRALTPNYQKTFNSVQRESNLKKALSYFVQHKIIRSDYLWKSKALLKRQNNTLEELVADFISHFNRLFKRQQMRMVNFVRYVRRQKNEEEEEKGQQKPQQKLQTTMANQTVIQPAPQVSSLEVNWMRKLGFNSNLQLNNGVLLCRLVAKLAMRTIQGVNQHPQSRAECLGNIRRAIKQLPKFKWDEYDIVQADNNRNIQVYAFLREQYKHSYALKSLS